MEYNHPNMQNTIKNLTAFLSGIVFSLTLTIPTH
ncbi:uncharacterized protein METZ01_LOCUS107628, partial [marine metagenome]